MQTEDEAREIDKSIREIVYYHGKLNTPNYTYDGDEKAVDKIIDRIVELEEYNTPINFILSTTTSTTW